MTAIMATSCLMHIFVFSKGPRAYRSNVSLDLTSTPAENPSPVTGRVTVLGVERFYLDDSKGQRWMFNLNGHTSPPLGASVRVFYRNTSPLQMTRSEILAKESP